jgi:probable addiction module antidote protein
MTKIACERGLSREGRYKALSVDRSARVDTILNVISALGLKLSASVKEDAIIEEVAEVA